VLLDVHLAVIVLGDDPPVIGSGQVLLVLIQQRLVVRVYFSFEAVSGCMEAGARLGGAEGARVST